MSVLFFLCVLRKPKGLTGVGILYQACEGWILEITFSNTDTSILFADRKIYQMVNLDKQSVLAECLILYLIYIFLAMK